MSRISLSQLPSNFQKLNRLPIPPLSETMNRYRASVMHLKKKESVEKHLDVVQRFEMGVGARLHAELVQEDFALAAANSYPFSYIERIWDDGYMEFRGPSPINICPALSLKKPKGVTSQADAAAKVVQGLGRWVAAARSHGVRYEPGIDASQLFHQFSTSKVPGAKRDTLLQGSLQTANQVVVLRHGHIYLMDVIDDESRVISEEHLKSSLQQILDVTSNEENHAPVGILTTGSRVDWSASFNELIRDPSNEVLMKRINTSIAVLCLDSVEWPSPTSVQEAMLFGGADAENRWFDMHQVIVSKDGHVAFNFEHAFSDGMTWCTWLDDIVNDGNPVEVSTAKPRVENVQFSLGKSFATRIRDAKQDLSKLTKSIQVSSPILPVGKSTLKRLQISPDAFAQMCLHHAYFKTHGKLAPTYESCSTNRFFHGRTETVRTASSQMLAVCQNLEASSDIEVLKGVIKDAASNHVRLAREAAAGLGVDRHLLALQNLAKQKNCLEAAEFFKEDLYAFSGTWLMSTSNISRPFLEYFSFGPVTPDGYGIGYVIDDEAIRMSVSAWISSSLTDSAEMKLAIEKSSQRLVDVLSKE